MNDRRIELARRIQGRPWNASGSDETWVLEAMWQHPLFQGEVREAKRVLAFEARARDEDDEA